MDSLDQLRIEINALDSEIMDLLDKRFTLSKAIGEIKQSLNLPIFDESREQLIYNKIAKYSHYPQIKQVYTTLMNESKNIQRK